MVRASFGRPVGLRSIVSRSYTAVGRASYQRGPGVWLGLSAAPRSLARFRRLPGSPAAVNTCKYVSAGCRHRSAIAGPQLQSLLDGIGWCFPWRANSRSPYQVFGVEFIIIPIRIKSDRLRACSFSIMWARCNSTVRKLMPR
jgi:hypothetical protein